MENPRWVHGLAGGYPKRLGTFVMRILPAKPLRLNPEWKRLCRASQSLETKKLVAKTLAALAAKAGDNVIYLDGER